MRVKGCHLLKACRWTQSAIAQRLSTQTACRKRARTKSSAIGLSFAGVRRSLVYLSWQRTKAVRLLFALSIRFNTTNLTTTIPEQSKIQDRGASANLMIALITKNTSPDSNTSQSEKDSKKTKLMNQKQ